MIQQNAPVLVVAPHPDDDVIGCGGTIASLSASGHQVDVVYMTAGFSGLPHKSDSTEAVELRESEARHAGRILGIRNQLFLRHPDRNLEYSLACVRQLITLLREHQYTGLYFPHGKERDRDHQVVHQIAAEASWMATSRYFPELGNSSNLTHVMMYEVWTPLQKVNWMQDISNFIELKVDAIAAHESQFDRAQAEQIVGLNRYRGAMSSHPKKAVEAFLFYAR